MPPEVIQLIRDGGVEALLLFGLAWLEGQRRREQAETKAATELVATERKARSDDGLEAAREMYDQKLLNQAATAAIELRDYRIADLTRDLEKCERTVERFRGAPQGGQAAS